MVIVSVVYTTPDEVGVWAEDELLSTGYGTPVEETKLETPLDSPVGWREMVVAL